MTKEIFADSVTEFNDPVRVYSYQGIRIALFKTDEGFFAINDTCSHAEASLSEGEVEDCEVECPLHGALFDLKTGKNLSFPAVTPVKSYPVKIKDGDIYIEVES